MQTPRTLTLEGEDMDSPAELRDRGAASGGLTLWIKPGTPATTRFNVTAGARYNVHVRYSNDNYDDRPVESVSISLDSTAVGSFQAQDTGGQGLGWENILATGPIGSAVLARGRHTLAVRVTGGDGLGVELDSLRLEPAA